MKGLPLLLLALLTSCGATTLYTDGVFRVAAPEVIAAWSELAPGHAVQVADLPHEAAKALSTRLPKSGAALIGAVLTSAERASLTAEFPQTRLVFFTASAQTGETDITVSRLEAWTVVAQKAGASHLPATALFPSDATTAELDQFTSAWIKAGGGTLTALVWPVTQLPGNDPLFQWAGTAAENLVKTLPKGRVVHTDPGMDRPAESTGLTWRIRRQGLGEVLWKAVSDTTKTTVFLPLEAVDNSHP